MILIMRIQSLQQKNWYIIDSESNGNFSHYNPLKIFNKFNRIKSLSSF